MYEKTVTNSNGREFGVNLVRMGDKYGLDKCLTHEEPKPMIEFYDLSYPETFGDEGQFVARYYIHTLLSRFNKQGARWVTLQLHGGVEDWQLTPENVEESVFWAWDQVWAEVV